MRLSIPKTAHLARFEWYTRRMRLETEIQRRRTFGIVSHPDAGKTTLTEKLLLFGGAIHAAGAIKAKKASRHATSDFMEIEKQRGISVSTSVMGFEYTGIKINLLDTPGHEDFCEDTYRTLTAVDSVIMVIDASKGIEAQTYKLLAICKQRNTPVITFINKLDREGLSPIELLDSIEEKLGIAVCPMSWPVGMGRDFRGVYDLTRRHLALFEPKATKETVILDDALNQPGSPLSDSEYAQFREDVALIEGVYPAFDRSAYLSGSITPVLFGSALNNFGVQQLLDCFVANAPEPQPRPTTAAPVSPQDSKFSGFIFKIHANIDPHHRDRIAFLRICSGQFERNKKYTHVQSGKVYRCANPTAFMAQSKHIIDVAYPGDIIGLHDTGQLKIGDSLSDGAPVVFTGIPNFSPEIFKRVVITDPLKQKALKKGIQQLTEEGVAQCFTRVLDQQLLVGTVGQLQFEVIQYRLAHEYKAGCQFEAVPFTQARWVSGPDAAIEALIRNRKPYVARDKHDRLVYLADTKWSVEREISDNPELTFHTSDDGLGASD
jgi:peptide chain release factor 3